MHFRYKKDKFTRNFTRDSIFKVPKAEKAPKRPKNAKCKTVVFVFILEMLVLVFDLLNLAGRVHHALEAAKQESQSPPEPNSVHPSALLFLRLASQSIVMISHPERDTKRPPQGYTLHSLKVDLQKVDPLESRLICFQGDLLSRGNVRLMIQHMHIIYSMICSILIPTHPIPEGPTPHPTPPVLGDGVCGA